MHPCIHCEKIIHLQRSFKFEQSFAPIPTPKQSYQRPISKTHISLVLCQIEPINQLSTRKVTPSSAAHYTSTEIPRASDRRRRRRLVGQLIRRRDTNYCDISGRGRVTRPYLVSPTTYIYSSPRGPVMRANRTARRIIPICVYLSTQTGARLVNKIWQFARLFSL